MTPNTLIPKRKTLLYVLFPNLRLVEFSYNSANFCYKFRRNRNKMQRPMKIGIGSLVLFLFIIIFGFILFPKMIKGKVKSMVKLTPDTEIRGMFTKVPFPLSFKVYLFNVTNPMEVQEGKKPALREIGPFCYEEWKEKVNVEDSDADDAMFYNAKDTFLPVNGEGCMTGEEMITMPHPMILGMVNTVSRQKPGMLSLVSKAINSIYKNPTSIYLTEKARNILFDGVSIDCSVKDFAGKAVCTQLKTEATDLKHVSDDELAFSFLTPKNGTESKRFKVLRGSKDYHKVGWITEFDGKKAMETWPTKACNQYLGTDGTIFPPFLKKEEGLVSFAPDLCRSLAAVYQKKDSYAGIPVRLYTATLGDMSKNPGEKCYCPTPETCLKRGVMDLYKCAGVPIIASLPHFYDCDKKYLNGVVGLKPNEKDHGIRILFEGMTGSPVSARKRLQFSMPLEPTPKIEIFKNLPEVYHPLFWIEEGVDLNKTYTGQLKTLFTMMKVVKIVNWLLLLASLGGMGGAAYLFFRAMGSSDITPVHKVKPADAETKNGVSTIQSHVNTAMSDNEIAKY